MPKGNATKEFIESLQLKPGQVVYKCPKCCSIKPDRAHHCRYTRAPPLRLPPPRFRPCPTAHTLWSSTPTPASRTGAIGHRASERPLRRARDHCDSVPISMSSLDWKGRLVQAQDTCARTWLCLPLATDPARPLTVSTSVSESVKLRGFLLFLTALLLR